MTKPPYICITGFTNTQEVGEGIAHCLDLKLDLSSTVAPMFGFLVNSKTLQGNYTNKRHAPIQQLNQLVTLAASHVLPMVHYHPSDRNTLAEEVTYLFKEYCDVTHCAGLQINKAWPGVNQVKKIKETFPALPIVWQANEQVLRAQSDQEIVKTIEPYKPFIDYVLFDPSGGKGKPTTFEREITTAKLTQKTHPQLIMGFAGGLRPETVSEYINQINQETNFTNGFCVDAESGLRNKNNELQLDKVREFLENASRSFT